MKVLVGAGSAQGVVANAQDFAAVPMQAQPNREPLIQQFTIQARPMVRAELIFVRNICKLDRQKFRQINRDADQTLDEVVNIMVDAQLRPRVAPAVQARAEVVAMERELAKLKAQEARRRKPRPWHVGWNWREPGFKSWREIRRPSDGRAQRNPTAASSSRMAWPPS